MNTVTTPVVSMTGEMSLVTLLPGHRRIWSGRIAIGDYYLNQVAFWQYGRIEWIRLSAARIIEDGHYYPTAEWFGCLTRETWEDKGYPCVECGCRSPMMGLDICDICAMIYYRVDS